MAYQLIYTKSASRDIQKLDAVAKGKIRRKIELYVQKPLTYAKKLTNSQLGGYRWRIGNYRAVFDIDGQKIIILRVGHRREIYRK
jgi:mRNA interferase RelE/StbE